MLEHAVKLVAEAWQSFDRYRPEEPPLDERVRRLLQTELPTGPASAHEAVDDAARILDESIAQPRPRYFVGVGSSGLEIGTIADLLAHTYDINLAVDARAATLVEKQAVRWAAEFIGYAPDAAGAFTSGGTVSNTTALAAAREHALPGSRYEGLGGKRVAIYCSQEVHYSVTRAVETLGVGSANLRAIPLGPERGLVPEALADAIDRDLADGVTPIAVVASAGTTLTGAIDPLAAIADICEERGVWFHVDGAYGLPAVAARPELFIGFERANSVSVDAHKWLYLPKACGILLVREQEALVASFGHEQGYLPHQRHELHAMETTFEYSRPFRALKFWLAMRVHGAAAFAEAIERNLGAGPAPVPDGLGQGRLRGAGPAEAVDRGLPSRAGRGRGRRLPQPSTGPGDPSRRARVDVERADRRRGLASPVLRELPNHRGGRARRRRDRGRDRRAPRPGLSGVRPSTLLAPRTHRPEGTGGNPNEMTEPLVGVVMGSASDWETMQHCARQLEAFGVPFETRVLSAHRTPRELTAWIADAESRGAEVFIAAAGMAAALPGVVAAQTTRPVLGVPMESKLAGGLDSLLSMVQMPGGSPSACSPSARRAP